MNDTQLEVWRHLVRYGFYYGFPLDGAPDEFVKGWLDRALAWDGKPTPPER